MERRRHAVHRGDKGLALAVRRRHRLRGTEADIVIGGIDRFEIGIGDQRVLGLLDAALAGQRPVGADATLMPGCFAITSI